MNEISEIKIPKGVYRIAVKQHDDKVVIEFIPEKSKFKNGDFVYEDGRIMIVKNHPNNYYAIIYPKLDRKPIYNRRYAPTMPLSSLSFRYATEDEKQLLIDALKKDGKRWNAEKLEIEDIPQPKFKAGDKVKIKDGISSKTHRCISPYFTSTMDEFIGKELTVKEYTYDGFVVFDDYGYQFAEDWLEPCSDELKKGDLAIFWDSGCLNPLIRLYHAKSYSGDGHYDNFGTAWDNAVKWDGTKEQFEKVSRGEI
jgi:hypothetical protein